VVVIEVHHPLAPSEFLHHFAPPAVQELSVEYEDGDVVAGVLVAVCAQTTPEAQKTNDVKNNAKRLVTSIRYY